MPHDDKVTISIKKHLTKEFLQYLEMKFLFMEWNGGKLVKGILKKICIKLAHIINLNEIKYYLIIEYDNYPNF